MSNVSETAKDFVRTCLTIDPAARPTAEEALRHRWLASDEPHGVQDAEGQMRNLLPQIQKAFDAKRTCESVVFFAFGRGFCAGYFGPGTCRSRFRFGVRLACASLVSLCGAYMPRWCGC